MKHGCSAGWYCLSSSRNVSAVTSGELPTPVARHDRNDWLAPTLALPVGTPADSPDALAEVTVELPVLVPSPRLPGAGRPTRRAGGSPGVRASGGSLVSRDAGGSLIVRSARGSLVALAATAPLGPHRSPGQDRRPGRYRSAHRRSPGRRLGLVRVTLVLMALAVVGAPAVITVGGGLSQALPGPAPSIVQTPDAVIGRPAAPADAVPGQTPVTHDALADRRIDLANRIHDVLSSQAAALLSGNEAAFVAPADPAVQPELHRRFAVLRALRVTGWDEQLASGPEPVADGTNPPRWRVGVRLRYCFVVVKCVPVGGVAPTEWTDVGGRLQMTSLAPSPASEMGPRPWEVTDLQVAVGNRVIMAAPGRYASRLTEALAAAENAAAVTDRYARWSPVPSRYLVFLAGPDEWNRWYGVRQSPWVAGYAMRVSADATEIVLNAQRVDDDAVPETLRHEFSHVVTLAGVTRDYSAHWWLVEGIAEYIRMVGRPVSSYPGLAATRRYVQSGRWSGDIALADPPATVTADDASGRYGVAFLALRRIADKYGEEKLLAFFAAVVRGGTPLDQASRTLLGTSWADLNASCGRYLRSV